MKRVLVAALLSGALAEAAPDLEVSKRVDNAVPDPGQPIEFTVDVRNVGLDTAIDVHLRDQLPPGLAIPAGMAPFPGSGTYDETTGDWAVGDLAAGTSATLQIPAIVTATDPADCIVNNAEVSHAADENSDNDRAMVAVRQPGVERCVDVATAFFTVGPGSNCGSERTFVVVVDVSNQGTDDASGVVVTVGQSPVIAPSLRFRTSG